MLRELFDGFVDVAKENAAALEKSSIAVVTQIPTDGKTVVIQHKGELVTRPVPPKLRSHTVATVEDLTAAAEKWGGSGVIWLGPKSAILVIDDEDRRDLVTLPLNECECFAFLREINKGRAFEQLAFIRLLRTTLLNAARRAEILTAVRKIKFRNHVSGASDIQHGNESMGQTIENEVTGADQLPDSLTITTHVFSNLGERDNQWPIAIDVEIDAAKKTFILKPLCDEVESVSQAALAGIADRIRGATETPVFFGTP